MLCGLLSTFNFFVKFDLQLCLFIFFCTQMDFIMLIGLPHRVREFGVDIDSLIELLISPPSPRKSLS